MLRAILNNSSGDAALSRFFTGNTWTAQQIFISPTTTSPGAVFQANGTISAIPVSEANVAAMFQGTEAVQSYTMFSSSAQQMNVLFRRRQGTYASPTAVQTNNVLGAVQWQGYGASTFGSVPAAEIRAYAQQAFTETARGTAMAFYVTANNTVTQQLTLTIFPTIVAATVDVSSTGFTMSKTAGNARLLSFQTASSNRWVVQANATAEGGSNAGSDFEIRRYSDAGADLGAVISINRANGGTIFANNVTFSTQASVDGAAGTNRLLLFRTSGSTRWTIFADNNSESGSNAGSFLNIARYSDAGAFLDSPIVISRSTGITQFNANKIQITTAQTPATSAAAGNAGDIAWDDTYLYVRMSTGWRRIALGAAF